MYKAKSLICEVLRKRSQIQIWAQWKQNVWLLFDRINKKAFEKFHNNIGTLFSDEYEGTVMKNKQIACLAIWSMSRLCVYTALFCHSSLFHLLHLLQHPRRRELVAPATHSRRTPLETQLLCELLLSPSLSRGGENRPLSTKAAKG